MCIKLRLVREEENEQQIIQALETEFMQNAKTCLHLDQVTLSSSGQSKEGERARLQSFEGVVIAKRNRGYNVFTVRKISHGGR